MHLEKQLVGCCELNVHAILTIELFGIQIF